MRTRRLKSSAGIVELTHSEYDLLMAFLRAPQRILSREQLLDLMRGTDSGIFDRSIDVQILRLRRKIEVDASRPQLIRTERGQGYSLASKVELIP
jgi:DNA-binding response OmpR family regulator